MPYYDAEARGRRTASVVLFLDFMHARITEAAATAPDAAAADRMLINMHSPLAWGACSVCRCISCSEGPNYTTCDTLRLLGYRWRSHPDYRPEWAPHADWTP
jgi:hypothetical protein